MEIPKEVKELLAEWFVPENRFVQPLGEEPKGHRDLMWCPYLNEPAIIEWDGMKPRCPNCSGNFEASTHVFMGHIWKPKG